MRKLLFNREQAFQMYIAGTSPNAIGNILGIDHRVISREIRSRGIELRDQCVYHRKYTLNENFFNLIDTEEKAYWLGFITADGCVTNAQLRIALQRSDKIHLDKFCSHLGSDAPIKDIEAPMMDVVSKKPNGKISYMSRVIICSRLLVNTLKNCGISEKKSLVVKPFNVDKILRRHYWRGLIDGDGWIAKHRNGHMSLGLCGSKDICKGFVDYVTQFGLKCNIRKRKNIWCAEVNNKSNTIILHNLLYTNSNISLDRKSSLI